MVSKLKQRVQAEAFILKSIPYSDHHRILSVLTPHHGRLDLIALGAQKSKKRSLGLLDYLNHLKIEFHQSGRGSLLQLDQVDLLESFEGIRKDWDRVQTALEWMKLLQDTLKPQGSVPGLFFLLQKSLNALSTGTGPWEDLVFRREALSLLGYQLQLEQCTRCGLPHSPQAFFLPEEGGMHCGDCHQTGGLELRGGFFPQDPWSFSEGAPSWVSKRGRQARKVLDRAFQSYFDT